MIGFFKRLIGRASGEALLSQMETEQQDKPGLRQANSVINLAREKVRARIFYRAVEIERLRRNKKKFSHLLAEQEADKAAINAGRF